MPRNALTVAAKGEHYDDRTPERDPANRGNQPPGSRRGYPGVQKKTQRPPDRGLLMYAGLLRY
jgi:hypothetical protein